MKTIHSKTLQNLLDKMEKDHWTIKLKRHLKLEVWFLKCYFFNRKKN